jgi:hypothetical protein
MPDGRTRCRHQGVSTPVAELSLPRHGRAFRGSDDFTVNCISAIDSDPTVETRGVHDEGIYLNHSALLEGANRVPNTKFPSQNVVNPRVALPVKFVAAGLLFRVFGPKGATQARR